MQILDASGGRVSSGSKKIILQMKIEDRGPIKRTLSPQAAKMDSKLIENSHQSLRSTNETRAAISVTKSRMDKSGTAR